MAAAASIGLRRKDIHTADNDISHKQAALHTTPNQHQIDWIFEVIPVLSSP